MKKPLLPALPLCFGLPLLALWLSFTILHPTPGRPAKKPRPDADTSAPATLQLAGNQLSLHLSPELLRGHYTNINLEWQTFVNGLPGQKGVLAHRNLSPRGPTTFLLPLRIKPGNDEVTIQVTGRLATSPQSPLFTILLPLRPWRGDYSIPSAGNLGFNDSNNIFTISSPKLLAQFDKQTGWLLHYETGGSTFMGDTAGLRSDLGLPDSLQPRLQLFFASTGEQIVIVKAEYTLPELNCLLHLSYSINAAGEMLVEQTLETDTAGGAHPAPTLPHFGMTWPLPQDLDSVTWYGSPGQTPPSIPPPLSLARESNFPGVRWLLLKTHQHKGLRIVADSNLLQLHALAADTTLNRLTLGIYKTIYPVTQPRLSYSYKLLPVHP